MSQAQGVQGFSLGLVHSPGRVVVTVRGDLDAATAPRLRAALDDLINNGSAQQLVVDLQGLTFLDSAGIYALVQAMKLASADGRNLTLSGTSPGAYKVLDICGSTNVFHLPRPSHRPLGAGAYRHHG